jgi:hypothetical protein
LYPSWLSLVTG